MIKGLGFNNVSFLILCALCFILRFSSTSAQQLSHFTLQAGPSLYSFETKSTYAGSKKYGYYSFATNWKIGGGVNFNIVKDNPRWKAEYNVFYFKDVLRLNYFRDSQPSPNRDNYEKVYRSNVLQNQVIFIYSNKAESFNFRTGLSLDLVLNTSATERGTSYENGSESYIHGADDEEFKNYHAGLLIGMSFGDEKIKFAFDYIHGLTPRYISGNSNNIYGGDPRSPHDQEDLANWSGQDFKRNMWTFTAIVMIFPRKDKKETE